MLLSNCGTDRINELALCDSLVVPQDNHADALILYGEQIISIGAGQVLITGNTLIQAQDAGCARPK